MNKLHSMKKKKKKKTSADISSIPFYHLTRHIVKERSSIYKDILYEAQLAAAADTSPASVSA